MRTQWFVFNAVTAAMFLAAAGYSQNPEGKEYTPQNKRFTITMPPGDKSGQRTQIITVKKSKVPIEAAFSAVTDGPTYSAASIGIPAKVMATIPADQRFDTIRDALLKQIQGKVVEEKDLMQGKLAGKDYQIEGKVNGRLQVYMQGGFVFYAFVEAKTKDEVKSKTADAFFKSFKMTPEAAEGK
jgi:hypothetical protein